MASSNSSNFKVTMKLLILIDKMNDKVPFAEASKFVVDFLFNMLCLPMVTIVNLLSNEGMIRSLGNMLLDNN